MDNRDRRAQRQQAIALRHRGLTWLEIQSQLLHQWPALAPLAAMRIAHGWTQSQAADAWNQKWSDRIKTDKDIGTMEARRPGINTLAQLAELYQCAVSDLITDTGNFRHLDDRAPSTATTSPPPTVGRTDVSSTVDGRFEMRPPDADTRLAIDDDLNSGSPPWGQAAPHEALLPSFDVLVVEAGLAESLTHAMHHYVSIDNLHGPRSLIPLVSRQTSSVVATLPHLSGRERRQLLYVAARYAELTGWLLQDDVKLDLAMAWTNVALDLAVEADDLPLQAYVWMRKSNIASDARRADLAMGLADAGLRHMSRLSPGLRAVSLRQRAHSQALAGDYDSCAHSLDQAYAAVDDVVPEPGDIAGYCTANYIEMEAAHCLIELGRPDEAIGTYRRAIAEWPDAYRRDHGLCLARLACAHAIAGDLDNAIDAASHSLHLLTLTRSGRSTVQLERSAAILDSNGADHHARHIRGELALLSRS